MIPSVSTGFFGRARPVSRYARTRSTGKRPDNGQQPDQRVRGNHGIDQIIPEVARFVRAPEVRDHRGDGDEHDRIEPRAPRRQGDQQQSGDELGRSVAERVRIERRQAQRERVQENGRGGNQPRKRAQIALSDQSVSGELRDACRANQNKRAYAQISSDAPNVSREREIAEGHEKRDPRDERSGDPYTDRKSPQAKRRRNERKTEQPAAEKA